MFRILRKHVKKNCDSLIIEFKLLIEYFQIIGAVYINQSEAGAGVAKLALIKGKVALAKVPHVLAHVAVAKEVKAKTKIAALKSLAAVSI